MRTFIISILLFTVSASLAQEKPKLFVHAVLYTGDGNVYTDGMFAFKGDSILYSGYYNPDFDFSNYEVIDASGKYIYPGFIAPNSTIGLREVDAVRATLDYAETGLYNPHVRSQIAYNAESVIIPTLRSNGILQAQVVPKGGVISGTSSVMQLDAWNWEDATVRKDDGVHINWPSMFKRTGWWAEPGKTELNKERDKQLTEIRAFLREAKAYSELKDRKETDPRFESLRDVFTGNKTVYFHANFSRELMEIARFVKDNSIPKAVIVGGSDAWRVPEALKESGLSVIIDRVHDLPKQEDDPVDLPYRLPALLHKAGVTFALSYDGDMEVMGSRNLPFTAGTAVTFGLRPEHAVQALTGNTAKILGIDKHTGTLIPGKDATFFISAGDALEMKTNRVEAAWIQGRPVDLGNKHIDLYNKYREKYGLE